MASAGYSGTPLIKKLGLKEGMVFSVLNCPVSYASLLGGLPAGTQQARTLRANTQFIHYFATSRAELRRALPRLRRALSQNGLLWISWPKRTSGVATDVTEDEVRALGLASGLVDVKVCAVDEVWSGLKFVYRLKDRKS
jgi:hypothetical protein